MKKILCFSGWGQKFNSLETLFDVDDFSNCEVTSIDYSEFHGLDEFSKHFSLEYGGRENDFDIVMGWRILLDFPYCIFYFLILNKSHFLLPAKTFE